MSEFRKANPGEVTPRLQEGGKLQRFTEACQETPGEWLCFAEASRANPGDWHKKTGLIWSSKANGDGTHKLFGMFPKKKRP